jgi:HEAT repeat protein
LQTNVRTLVVLVACCAAILWALRHVWENSDPVLLEARSIQKRAIRDLQSGKPAQRLSAIKELERLRVGDSSSAIPSLIGALEGQEIEVRVAAAEALGPICAGVKSVSGGEMVRAAAMALLRSLEDPEPAVRIAAAEALGLIGSAAVKSESGAATARAATTAILAFLKDSKPEVRSAAVTSLGRIAREKAAATATAASDRAALMDAMAEAFGDRDTKVRLAAVNAIGSLPRGSDPPGNLAEALTDESPEIRVAAIRGLIFARRGLDPWAAILLGLAEHDPDRSVREQCLITLSYAFKPPAVTASVVPNLIASLKSRDANVRSQTASLLGQFGADARAAIPELLRVLNEPLSTGVGPFIGPGKTLDPACAAASALGRIAPGSGDAKSVIEDLIMVARAGPLTRRGWAAYALGEFGSAAENAIPVLIKVMSDATPDDELEHGASSAHALGAIAPGTPSADQAIAALVRALSSSTWFCRVQAMNALRQFGRQAATAIPKIRALKDDRDAEVRDAAERALRAIEAGSSPWTRGSAFTG